VVGVRWLLVRVRWLLGTLNWWWDSTSGSGNADFFRNLFGAGQAPNPDYEYEFDSQQGSGNFMPGGVDPAR